VIVVLPRPVFRRHLAAAVGLLALTGDAFGAGFQEEPVEEAQAEDTQSEEPEVEAPQAGEPQEEVESETPLADEALALTPAVPTDSEEPRWLDALRKVPIHGLFSTTYRGRWTSGDTDNDLRAWLYLDLGDPEQDKFTGRFNGILYWDLDRQQNGQDPYYDINDTYDHSLEGRLYEAYVEAHVDGLSVARAGRVQILETPVLAWFDGAYVETEEATERDVFFGAYGGVPVHTFESSSSGDGMFGAFVGGRPWTGAKLRFDYMRFQDENYFGDHNNDLYNLGWWQTLVEGVFLEADYSRLDDSSRDVLGRVTYYDTDSDFMVQASYYELLHTQADLALEVDPFYGALLELYPYYQTRFLASKSLLEWIYLEGGTDIRRVKDGDDEGDFNRDFERYYFVTSFQDVWRDGLDFSINGDAYNSDGNDTQAWGLDATRRFDEQWEGSLGTYYSLYKYDYLDGNERDNVRTYYVKAEYDRTENLAFDLGYEFEDSFQDYQTLRVGMSWRF